ncbi:MAG: response regulator [Deltaproteobacteria bacterium]|nr:response regulator [Deltaproteobacteria bacterium]
MDDNTATRRAVRNALQRNGHEVIEAPDGKTAREMMARWHPRVVLQDLMLPDADGFTLVGELRKLAGTSDVAILAFSGFISELLESRVSTVEFDDIITKPIAPSRLVPIIEAHLPRVAATSSERFGAKRRLVIADDDPIQLKLAAFKLARLGFDVVTACDGRAALAAIRSRTPDIVVSDVMMPELDGFGLAMELRKETRYSRLPLLLVTSSYVEAPDRELARKAGANDLIPRTPELVELVDALRTTLEAAPVPLELPLESFPALEREHNQRVFRQLERQVRLNSGLAKRCSSLASELTVLTGISATILEHRDLDVALDGALADCFDAGGIAAGALYLIGDAGKLSIRQLGSGQPWATDEVETLFGRAALLDEVIYGGRALIVPSGIAPGVADDLLSRASATQMMVVPLGRPNEPFGALLMAVRSRDLDQDDWRAFAQGVATQIANVISLARAYDARSNAERLAKQQAALLQAVVASAPDIIMQVDLGGVIRFINRALQSKLPPELLGTDWFSMLPEPQRTTVRTAFDTTIRTAQPTEVEQQFSSGTFSIHLGPVIEGEHVTGVVVVARDVSEKKQAEIQLVLADRMASVGTLAAGVAHEINNPLASVIANLDLASTDIGALGEHTILPPDLVEEIRDARLAAERVREIVKDLKIFSRAEEDRRGPIDVEQVLDATLRMAWTELRHRARVVKDYGHVPPVEANESRLGQVFLNLLINAAHAIPEGKYDSNEIRIATTLRDGNVIITVSDTGSGIPLEVRSRLFTPFFTTKPVGVGTGLGLAISLKIISSFGGTIAFDTELGRGTEFAVTLPASTSVAPVAVGRTPTRQPATRRGKILVVDDDVQLGHAIRRYLSAFHEVEVVQSGRAALDRFDQGARFDVLLCDVMMPQVTGMEVYDTIARLDPAQAAKIVFLTGGAFTIAAREFLDRSTNPRLDKPFDLKALRRLVHDMIR